VGPPTCRWQVPKAVEASNRLQGRNEPSFAFARFRRRLWLHKLRAIFAGDFWQ
jgi:hypothetical protein